MMPAVLTLAMPPHLVVVSPKQKRQPSRAGAPTDEPRTVFRRVPHDFYPTPSSAIRAFLAAEQFDGSVWEPACGDGAIAKELVAYGYDVTATDLIDRGYGRGNVDFLDTIFPRGKHIVTNPPYGQGLADAFVKHALKMTAITGGRVAMLLNIASLCHPDRTPFFHERPPSVLYALDDCVCLPWGKPAAATRFTHMHRYVFAVWEAQSVPATGTAFKWLATAPFTDAAIRAANRHLKQPRRLS